MINLITYFELAAFIASLIAWKVIRKSPSMRLFPLLLGVVAGVEWYDMLFRSPQDGTNEWLYNIQVPVQHVLYLAILYYAISSRQAHKFIAAAIAVFILVSIATGIYFTKIREFNIWSYCFGSLLIIIGITIKFYEMLLEDPNELIFSRNPFFYMLFAFLLFNLFTLPYFAMANWLYHTVGYQRWVKALGNAMLILNLILYGTYTTAFIWMRKKGSY